MTSSTFNVCRYVIVPLVLPAWLGCVGETPREPDARSAPAVGASPEHKASPATPLEKPGEAEEESGSGTVELGGECPPDAPYFCRDACSPTPCPASCERSGCPASFACKDCGDGFACVPHDAC
jgi:hypothetical protein